MGDLAVKSGGSWRTITAPEVKSGGTWRAVQTVEVKVGGTWQTVFNALSVIVAATKSISDIEDDPLNAEALVKVDSDGGLYAGTPSYSFYETWLDAGSNTQVWVQRTIISGSLNTDAGSGVLACTSDRAFGVLQSVVGSTTCVIDLKFYSDSGGTQLLDTQRVTLFAQVESGA
jgi:hypothetical protein